MSELNVQQQKAVEHIGSPLLVLAGAGSGKTRVITHKIAHLIQHLDFKPAHLTAVTFTNKAAREMKSRITQLLKGKDSRGITISTFHSLGLAILRKEHTHIGYRKGFSILDTQDSALILSELSKKAFDEPDIQAIRWQISQWKNDLTDPDHALNNAENDAEHGHAKIYQRYQQQLLAYNAVDFDDLISKPTQALQGSYDIRERWQAKIRHLLIDEYQDTNLSQYALMRLLVGVNTGLTVVGDDDQSVYAWRGARSDNLIKLNQDYPSLQIIKLEQNFRSTEKILQTANHLIANNPHLFEKRLWSRRGLGEDIRVLPCKNPDHEAEKIVLDIINKHFKFNDDYNNYAILYRGNYQSRPFEQALRSHHIPYTISGGTSFFERQEIKDILAYLRILANPGDDPALLRIINTPRRSIGPATLEKVGNYAHQRHLSLFEACQELGLREQLGAPARLRLDRFLDWLKETSRGATEQSPARLAQHVINEVGYSDWLSETSSSPDIAEKRMKNVAELLEWIKHISEGEDAKSEDIGDVVAHMTLMDFIERTSSEKDANGIQLMTLHAAKGLEFPHVWMVGMEEGLLPHQNSSDDSALEEERRLTYVGITRAQKSLTLSYARIRNRYGEKIDCEPSRFLAELPEEHVIWDHGGSKPNTPQARETGKAHISNLKELLGS